MMAFFLAIGQTLWVRLGLYCGEARTLCPERRSFALCSIAGQEPLTTGANVNPFKCAVVCVAVVVMCGCDQGQPTPPAPSANGNATSAVTAPDFAATKKDAEIGDAEAQHNLGLWYYNGQGVPQDFAEAVKWTRLAADQGYVRAQYNLGGMYDNGEGVPQDDAEAVKWYRFAADQGYVLAQYNLGLMYRLGQGVPQDDAEAVKWYRFAAVQSDTDAQYNLGGMYYNGQGVPKDLVEAYAWWVIAAASGDADAANNRSVVARELTPDQLSQGQKRATELLKKIDSGKQPSQGEAAAESGTSSGPTSLKPSS